MNLRSQTVQISPLYPEVLLGNSLVLNRHLEQKVLAQNEQFLASLMFLYCSEQQLHLDDCAPDISLGCFIVKMQSSNV